MTDLAYKSQVYLTCRPIFCGENAKVRKQKVVKDFIKRSRASLLPLLKINGEAKLIAVLRELLEAAYLSQRKKPKQPFLSCFASHPLANRSGRLLRGMRFASMQRPSVS